ncbi:MAG: phosphodiesterase [Rhodobacterales bacterium]|nr:MAG: phosphodiesterase [Rhodobacterales bacterium]
MSAPLPPEFLARPITHRALHDRAAGRIENSPTAIKAAVEHGYGIEIDLQLSADGQAIVFHDYDLSRLTEAKGPVQLRTAEELAQIALKDSTDTIRTLPEILEIVAGKSPLLIEIKDQDGAMGRDVGLLENAVVVALETYSGPAAVMSFNPHSVALFADLAPNLPRGLTTCAYTQQDMPHLSPATRASLAGFPDFERIGASFISHDAKDLDAPRVHEIKQTGYPVLCWTIRSADEERAARRIADNVTFEGYLP